MAGRQFGAGLPVSVVGTLGVGNTLLALLAPGLTLTGWQWQRDGVDIVGATNAAYLQVAADDNKQLRVRTVGLAYTSPSFTVTSAAVVTYLVDENGDQWTDESGNAFILE